MPDQEPPVVTHEVPDSSEFSIPVEIEGLPYIFKGTLPENPSSFRFTIHVPDWEARLREIKAAKQIYLFGSEFQDFEGNEGQVGYVALSRSTSGADIHIRKIKSATWVMPRESSYFDAHGVGSFLMNNLCAFADLKNWSISAEPYPEGGGRLDIGDIYQWNIKKGFVDSDRAMVRSPQRPDMAQAIAQVVRPQPGAITRAGVGRR